MTDLLGRLSIPGFDASSYISKNKNNVSSLPNIALAFSGGGYRATLNGGGALKSFDSREQNATAAGHLGGLLQSATYIAGLSGGGWLVGSIYVNNFTTISALQESPKGSVWSFGNSILQGPESGGIDAINTGEYFDDLFNDVGDKKDAGFETSLTDYWGRGLSYQLVNASNGGPSYTWSSIQLQDSFSSADAPMPILVADGRAPGEVLISGTTTVYEFNPFEFGSWDPTTFGFVPLEFLGSNFTGGDLVMGAKCVRGFDNVGYVMGTSSSLFNQFVLQVNDSSIPDAAKKFANKVLGAISQDNNDIADYTPNPFFGYNSKSNINAESQRLTLVDGGEDLENLPLHPLIQPNRDVDVIFAVDSSADTDNYWPNGTSLVATYQRSLNDTIANGTAFPAVPDTNSFVNLGLNTHPTFFGCNSSNTSSMTPLIVYIPNFPYVFHSNISTFNLKYTNPTRDAVLENGYNVATMGNATIDPMWPTCVACAILSRSMERTKTDVPDACTQCFNKYCWDGSTSPGNPPAYEPTYKTDTVVKSAASDAFGISRVLVAAAVGLLCWFIL